MDPAEVQPETQDGDSCELPWAKQAKKTKTDGDEEAAAEPLGEAVWDYPRPPRVEPSTRLVRVVHRGVTVADSRRALRVLETGHPPVYYIPPEDVRRELLRPSRRTTFCEFKGQAAYYDLIVAGQVVADAAWYYPQPLPGYEAILDYVAFYPSKVDACLVDEERVMAQAGGFYGGWITADIRGPFKG